MSYPNSGSLLQPRINSSLSSQIKIKIGQTTVGAIQSLTIEQNRDMDVREEIGTEGIVEIQPTRATKTTIEVSRIVFDDLKLLESFARGFVNLQAQRIPFDIHIMDLSSAKTENDVAVTICNNCWFKRYSTPYTANNYLITEGATILCERVTSMRNGLNVSNGGLRGIGYDYDSIERSTDLSGRIGRFYNTGISK